MTWYFLAILSAIFAALVAIFGKIGVSEVDSTLATTVRALIMSVFLIAVALFSGKLDLISTIKNKTFLFIVLSGIAGALSWLFYFLALKKGSAPGVAAIDRLSIVFVVILSILVLGDKLTWKLILGAVLMIAGALLITFK